MKVTYLYHSGFAIEDEQALYVFDYYKGELPVIAKEKQMYVFVSHRHKDHYNSEIFDWEKEHPNILYILSDDVEAESAPNRIFVKPEQKIRTGELKVETLRSTDEGVAFLVTCKDLPCRGSELVALGGREYRLQPADAERLSKRDQKACKKEDRSCLCRTGSQTGRRRLLWYRFFYAERQGKPCVPNAYVERLWIDGSSAYF